MNNICAGGHHYALKMYVYEKVRARNFGRAWGYIQVYMQVCILLHKKYGHRKHKK